MTIRRIDLTPTKTYKTAENAQAAVDKKFPNGLADSQVWYFVAQHTDGRFFPVFVGERAIQSMLHFHFNVIA